MKTVVIHRCYDDIEAEQIREFLDAHDIVSQVASDVPHSVFPFTMDGLGEIRIAVLEEEANRARELIDEFLNGSNGTFSGFESPE